MNTASTGWQQHSRSLSTSCDDAGAISNTKWCRRVGFVAVVCAMMVHPTQSAPGHFLFRNRLLSYWTHQMSSQRRALRLCMGRCTTDRSKNMLHHAQLHCRATQRENDRSQTSGQSRVPSSPFVSHVFGPWEEARCKSSAVAVLFIYFFHSIHRRHIAAFKKQIVTTTQLCDGNLCFCSREPPEQGKKEPLVRWHL